MLVFCVGRNGLARLWARCVFIADVDNVVCDERF